MYAVTRARDNIKSGFGNLLLASTQTRTGALELWAAKAINYICYYMFCPDLSLIMQQYFQYHMAIEPLCFILRLASGQFRTYILAVFFFNIWEQNLSILASRNYKKNKNLG
jgi:hypothetical protein